MRRYPKCQRCKKQEAVWAMQVIPGNDGVPSFTLLGNHYRGSPVVKVCDDCKERVQRGEPLAAES